MVNECMQLCTRNACDGRACTCAGTAFEKAHARMKRTLRVTESIRKIPGQRQRRRRKSSLA